MERWADWRQVGKMNKSRIKTKWTKYSESHRPISCWSFFYFDYRMDLLCYHLDKLEQYENIYFFTSSNMNFFSLQDLIWRLEKMSDHSVKSSPAHQRLSAGLRCWLHRGWSMCENDCAPWTSLFTINILEHACAFL